MSASFPPHSATIGVRFSAQAAMTFFAVAAEPVNAILLTALRARQAPVSPAPGTSCSTGCSGTTSPNELTPPAAAGPVSSLGFTTTSAPQAPRSPAPVPGCSPAGSGPTSANGLTPAVGASLVSSLGLNTTAFPAASAYAIEPMGVNTG